MSLGYYPKETTRVVFDYLYFPIQGSNHFAALLGATQRYYRLSSYIPTNSYVLCYGNQQEMPTGFTIDGAVEVGNLYIKVDGNTVYTGNTTGPFTSNIYLTLGADKPSGGDTLDNITTKIGRFCIYEGDTLVAEFIPALDENNVAGMYNKTNDTFLYSSSSPWSAGPDASSISINASKTIVNATGETITIEVSCENAWTVTGNTFLTLSSTGDTGSTTITATAPSYTGATERTDTMTFTDSVSGDEAVLSIKQKKYSSGQPFYLGENEVTEVYLGEHKINEAYLGEVLVYSSGPFIGLKLSPNDISFNPASLSSELKVKSSEAWSMTLPAWISASQTTGDSGETVITLTATTQTATTTGTVSVTTTNYSASADVTYYNVEFVDYIHSQNMVNNSQEYITLPVNCTANSRVRIVGKGARCTTGWMVIGNGLSDQSGDWRWFGTGPTRIYLDINHNRLDNSGSDYNPFGMNYDFDFTLGNHYWTAEYNGQTYNVNGAYQYNVTSQPFILVLGVLWISAVQIWDGETLVFDGKAAKSGNDYGLFDTVGGEFITSSAFTIVGENNE